MTATLRECSFDVSMCFNSVVLPDPVCVCVGSILGIQSQDRLILCVRQTERERSRVPPKHLL